MERKTAFEFLEPSIKSYWDSHQFDNYLHEEGEYIPLDDAELAMEEYSNQQNKELKDDLKMANKTISYAAEQKFIREEAYDELKKAAGDMANVLATLLDPFDNGREYEKRIINKVLGNYQSINLLK